MPKKNHRPPPHHLPARPQPRRSPTGAKIPHPRRGPACAEIHESTRSEKHPSTGSREEKTATLQNEGEPTPRAPLTPLELLVQAMICSHEFVYVN
jgi:hypothetical protein